MLTTGECRVTSNPQMLVWVGNGDDFYVGPGSQEPKKGTQETPDAPEGELVDMDTSGLEAYHPALGRGRFDPSPAERGNSKWRRSLALSPRMDIAE
jgi:hypothetical protein